MKPESAHVSTHGIVERLRTQNAELIEARHNLEIRLTAELREAADKYLAVVESGRREIERLRAALRELLSGHDNLYEAHFGHLGFKPTDDIAAKAARAALEDNK